MTLLELLLEGTAVLEESGVEEAALDARYLLLEAFHMDLAEYLMERGREIPEGEENREKTERYRELLTGRRSRIPLQYLCGRQEFMGMEFLVNPSVLIPRQDTETLVEAVLKEHPSPELRVLDMCTGSGCIAVSLKKLGRYERVVAADISREALDTAAENARRNLVDIQLARSDLFSGLDSGLDRFDVIVSNPPYIPSGVIEGLQPEVKDCEPRLALDGREDGLYFYRRLAAESGRFLNHRGCVYFEIGYDQAKDVGNLLRESGYTNIEVMKDGPGLDRVVKAVRGETGGTYV